MVTRLRVQPCIAERGIASIPGWEIMVSWRAFVWGDVLVKRVLMPEIQPPEDQGPIC